MNKEINANKIYATWFFTQKEYCTLRDEFEFSEEALLITPRVSNYGSKHNHCGNHRQIWSKEIKTRRGVKVVMTRSLSCRVQN